MSLPYDVCRCHDAECPMRENCQRWTHRQDEAPNVVHAMTMFCRLPGGKQGASSFHHLLRSYGIAEECLNQIPTK